MKTTIGPSDKFKNPVAQPGWSIWIESGMWYTAPTVDPDKFGPHEYEQTFTGMCSCGCNMWSSSSSGPVDPFGKCPNNPNPFTAKSDIPPPPQVGFWRSARGENHGLNSQPGDEWVNSNEITDTDRLRWIVEYLVESNVGEMPDDFGLARNWIDMRMAECGMSKIGVSE